MIQEKEKSIKTYEPDLQWVNFSENDIKDLKDKTIKLTTDFKKQVLSIDKKDLDFKNLMHTGEILSAKLSEICNSLWCFINLHTDKNLREIARITELEISEIIRIFNYDLEIYELFKFYFSNKFKVEVKEKLITEEEIKIVNETKKGYKKMGMELVKSDRVKLLKIQAKINKIGSEFDKLATENYSKGLFFEKSELLGVPENILKNFSFDEKKNKYFVSIRPTEISYVLKYCQNENTRKKMAELSSFGVGDKNTKKLAEILKLRYELTKLIGYKTFSELAVSEEMVSSPKEINSFLVNFQKNIKKTFESDKKKAFSTLVEWQRKNYQDKNKISKNLKTWNWDFAENIEREKTLLVKEEEYKPYFELENSLKVLFEIWEKFFDVKTEKVHDKKFFHESERVYKFTNILNGQVLGLGVFDLFPREDKYGHACMCDILSGYEDINGNKQQKLIYMVCNFMKNTEGANLLSFNDLITLYHEAGHFLHFLIMDYKHKSSMSVSNDFVEIPSQFFENFVLNEKFVKENFKHFETKEIMPDRLLKKISKLNKKGEATSWMTQTMYALFDQELHGKNINKYYSNFKNIDKLFNNMYKKIISVETVKERHFASRFLHIIGGYQAKYYSYSVSKIYSIDFWNTFSKKGIDRNKIIEKYKKLLMAGGTKNEKDLVKEFLGRPVSFKPFLKLIQK